MNRAETLAYARVFPAPRPLRSISYATSWPVSQFANVDDEKWASRSRESLTKTPFRNPAVNRQNLATNSNHVLQATDLRYVKSYTFLTILKPIIFFNRAHPTFSNMTHPTIRHTLKISFQWMSNSIRVGLIQCMFQSRVGSISKNRVGLIKIFCKEKNSFLKN